MSNYTYTYWPDKTGVTRSDGKGIPKGPLGTLWTTFLTDCIIAGLISQEQKYTDFLPDGDGVLLFDYVESGPELSDAKIGAKLEIDRLAEDVRQRYITSGDGQSMVYRAKVEEAKAYKAAGYPGDTSSYPFVAADASALGLTPTQAANDIITQEAVWIVIGASIEQQRLLGKKNVDAAVDVDAVNTAKDNALTALDAI